MQTVVITGGNRGLGAFQTRKYLSEGYRVYVVCRSDGDLEAIRGENLGGELIAIEQDLSDWRNVAFLDKIKSEVGQIDALINNAGIHLKKPIWDVLPDELEGVLDINVKAMFMLCGRYVALSRETGGAIVNLSSMGGLMALQSAAAYVTAKTAVIGLTRSVAVDAAPFGIRCNAVCPGFIETDMTRAILAKDPARRDKIEGRIPTHKFGTPQDVANATYFLTSSQSTYINGVSLPVDGGYAIGF
ncbi:MAG: SDR family oxidoreductase [Asticcacaulis sp.]